MSVIRCTRWLADLRRLPSVTDVRLDRLSRDETEQQLALLLGGVPHRELVDDGRTTIRRQSLPQRAARPGGHEHRRGLPADLPAELTGALLAAWHRLSAPGREVMRVLAVAGRPTSIDDLTEVAAARGIGRRGADQRVGRGDERRDLRGAGSPTCAGSAIRCSPRSCTRPSFPARRSPCTPPGPKTLESRPATGLDEVQRQGDLALHYERAHDLEACLEASLRAADLAKGFRAPREEAVHLRRAARLWPMVHRGGSDGAGQRGGPAGARCPGQRSARRRRGELRGVEPRARARRRAHRPAARLPAAEAMGRLGLGDRQNQGRPVAEAEHAVELSQAFPDSEEYADGTGVSQLVSMVEQRAGARRGGTPRTRSRQPIDPGPRGTGLAPTQPVATRTSDGERSDRDTAEGLRFARADRRPGTDLAGPRDQAELSEPARSRAGMRRDAPRVPPVALDVGALSVAVFAAGCWPITS